MDQFSQSFEIPEEKHHDHSPPSSTPIMNSIEEEENTLEPPNFPQPPGFHTPLAKSEPGFNSASSSAQKSGLQSPILPQPPQAFYASYEGNNSSSSLIYNPSFTFGNVNTGSPTPAQAPQTPQQQQLRPPTLTGSQSSATKQSNRQSRYIPGPKLAPPTTRTRSPTRSSSPDARLKRSSRPSSALFEAPFNLAPPPSMQSPPPSASSSNTRTMFRKGHRYKHSSVSMNFFQEPEVKIPLSIAKSLPIPDLNDLIKNFSWPRAHFQLFLTFIQLCMCLLVFQLGHHNSWSNFGTLSHFIAYDVIGSIAIIFVENLSQFEVWYTGTITYPFGLNRIEVLISFSLAVSLCFVGLDLLFHIVEECIVLFVELDNKNHEEIASQIPHSHHGANNHFSQDSNFALWYPVLTINLLISAVSLYKIFYANKYSKLKTKNPIITITYTLYLLLYPSLVGYLSAISDYLAAAFIAAIILFHGMTIAEWTSTILLLGFSTTTLPKPHFLGDTLGESSQQEDQLDTMVRKRSVSGISLAENNTLLQKRNRSWFPWTGSSKIGPNDDTTVLKSMMKEEIEKLPEFLTKCSLHYDKFFVAKVSFNLYVVLVNVTLRGGSDSDELNLRLAVDKCIQRILPNAETTVEIDRI
ncbi:ZYRO0C12056p [Zygosaccharomyces rouxii]|uniref:ZYRO0C12056p n=2 Tax=Zygosaccharomyces rouxii TaxID=4956 RepID=C5DTX5_ZYGRC|nr:uncharacterized protein ZYRO0C12056g [Zygosaccharomyces rouxii]KAH9201589.1 protein ZRG17 [Zygosaccharomyces rouxii]CAQ43246.1 Protein ZRG17 [Zygosaccharomyces rouxii]CAQ43536.1 Protein ZRG17 [Zygosaccharomyces rouxii]CAR27236.1 ZYRO0C12056p [Zygosaccharomyces rouxii]